MKKAIVLTIAALFCVTAFADGWCFGVYFDGRQITDEPLLLRPDDPITYSNSLAEGETKSLVITVEDQEDPEIGAQLYASSFGPWGGTFCWDYTDEKYKDFPTDDTYVLKETIKTDTETKEYDRIITILPEPAGLLAIAVIGAFFLRKRMKGLIAVLTVASLGFFSTQAEGAVESVTGLQNWPFDRSVIIHYYLTSDQANPTFNVKFFGGIGDAEQLFDLSEKGTLSKEGADGTVVGTGWHETLWSPDESFYETVTYDLIIKVEASEQALPPNGSYIVIDLSGGPEAASFPVTGLDKEPEGGWTLEYKKTKLVLKKIDPAVFMIGSRSEELGKNDNEVRHQVVLTPIIYAGVFEVTQMQYELVTGANPSLFKGVTRPVERVSYNMLRGAEKGANWPANNKVDEDSFFGILRAKTGLSFDLPTEAQWEFACRAITDSALNSGYDLTSTTKDLDLDELARYWYDGGGNPEEGTISQAHNFVGTYKPNYYGLYDMHGNVWEWCLDWYQANLGTGEATDPKGPRTGTYRTLRGGGCYSPAADCRSATRDFAKPNFGDYSGCGVRVFLVQ